MLRETYRIEAPHFVAGVETVDRIITRAAPIVKWTRGKNIRELLDYCRRKGWKITCLTE